jgi:DNA-binding transcriptional ArsR family regulator
MTNHETVLNALADPTRRTIFERLAEQPTTVGDLARDLPISRPAVSQHLKVLKVAGLVQDERRGTRRLYTVDPAGLTAVRDYFDSFWQTSLGAFRTAASNPSKEDT